jgi:hypothetical protein
MNFVTKVKQHEDISCGRRACMLAAIVVTCELHAYSLHNKHLFLIYAISVLKVQMGLF